MAKTVEGKALKRMQPNSSWNARRKLKAAVGKIDMSKIKGAEARPGEWRKMLTDNRTRDVPAVLEDEIIEDTANGQTAKDIEDRLGLNQGTVRRVLIRRFGGVEQMKAALEKQCLENAIIFNEHAANNVTKMQPGQAAVAAKIMIDGALALGKSQTNKPATIDFDSFMILGETLDRMEKRLTSAEVTEV